MRSFKASERREFRAFLIKVYGPYCQLCIKAGRSKKLALIQLDVINEDKSWSIDHIIPVSRGGLNILENMWPSHRSCNSFRGNDSIKEVRNDQG